MTRWNLRLINGQRCGTGMPSGADYIGFEPSEGPATVGRSFVSPSDRAAGEAIYGGKSGFGANSSTILMKI